MVPKLFLLITVGLLLTQDTSTASSKTYLCPDDFLRIGFNCYYLSGDMVTWDQAFYECWKRGTELTDIDGPWEDRILKAYLGQHQLTKLNRWIGGISNWHQNTWIWASTGYPINYKGFEDGAEHRAYPWYCIYLDPTTGYGWNTASCLRPMHYVCKTPQIKVIVEENNQE